MQILARQLGTGRVMGVDVSWKFVQQSRARFPHLTFERIDVLEDTAFVAGLVASSKQREVGGREGSSNRKLWAWVDIGGIRELSGLARLLPIVIDQVDFLCLLPRSAACGGRKKIVLPSCCATACLRTHVCWPAHLLPASCSWEHLYAS